LLVLYVEVILINSLDLLFQFGTSALYFDSTGKTLECRVFLDTGWRDSLPGYDSHPAEIITIVSILLADVPVPRISDQLLIEDTIFTIVSVQAQDEIMAALHVKKL